MEPSPRPPRRWVRRLARAAEAALVVAVLGALGLQCSVPDTAPLAAENPSSTAFIDLRRAEAEAAGKPFALRWQWRPLGAISRYLRAAVIGAGHAPSDGQGSADRPAAPQLPAAPVGGAEHAPRRPAGHR